MVCTTFRISCGLGLAVFALACSPSRSNPFDTDAPITETAPIIASADPVEVAPGETLRLLVTAVDADIGADIDADAEQAAEDAVEIAVTGELPANASFDVERRVLVFAPSQDQAGESYVATFIATDSTGQSQTTEVRLAVSSGCLDTDLDGFDGFHATACATGLDCDDAHSLVRPGVEELPCDGVDNDCDPTTTDDPDPVDQDNDGVTRGCGDCDDTDDAIYKGRAEECDGADNDCNGVVDDVDEDGDFFSACRVSGERIDCRDDDPNSHPRAEELCDGIDNDCDDEIDEGCP